MSIVENGILREMTQEEIEAERRLAEAMKNAEPGLHDRLAALEAAAVNGN